MLRRLSDLIVGVAIALLLTGLVLPGYLPRFLQGILAVPFALLIPGNALISALFPASSSKPLERFLYTLGSSLAVIIVGGLVLNLTPWGLQAGSWLVLLSVFTIIASVVAGLRRWNKPVSESSSMHLNIPLRQLSLLGLAVVVMGFAANLARTPRIPDNIQGYTSLSILPAPPAAPVSLLIDVHSQEVTTTSYHLTVTFNGQTLQEWPAFSLAPGGQWQQVISLPAGKGLVEAVLYRVDNPGLVFRHVSVTINR